MLAGSAYLTLRHRREQQMRMRAPGKSLPQPQPAIRPVEKTIVAAGVGECQHSPGDGPTVAGAGATQLASGRSAPQVDTVELTDQHIALHLREAVDLSEPWTKGSDQRTWSTQYTHALARGGMEQQPAPYPLLVTLGSGDNGHIWLLNLEGLGVIEVVGDRTYGDDLLRYVGAELAVNPWSRDVTVACVGVATEVGPMNVERIRTFDSAEAVANEMRLEAEATIARASAVGASTSSARAAQPADEAWPAQVLLLDGELADDPSMADLLDLTSAHPERSATVVLVSPPAPRSSARPPCGSRRRPWTTDHSASRPRSHQRRTDTGRGWGLRAALGQADDVVDSTGPESLPTEEDDQLRPRRQVTMMVSSAKRQRRRGP